MRIAARLAIVAMLIFGGVPALAADDPDALNRHAVELYGKGEYKEATAIAEKALALAERMLGPQHLDTLTSVNNLGLLYDQQGRYAEAEPLYKRALAGRETALGPQHPSTLTSVNNLGFFYQTQRRYAEAEPLYQRALAGRETAPGSQHPDTLVSVNNLGTLYQTQGRYSEAEPLYQRALAGLEKARGPQHPSTLTSVTNLGLLYDAQGRYSEAEPLYQRALAGREKALGLEHPDTLASVNYLGTLYRTQGRYAEAEPLYKRALAGREKALGPQHPDTLTSVNNLGLLYRTQGRSETVPLYQRALAGRETALGPLHPNTLESVDNLGTLYLAQGRYSEAELLFQRALAGYETVLGPQHRNTLTSVHNLGLLYYTQGRYSEAEPLYQRALAGYETALGPEHPDTLICVNNLGGLYFADRDWRRAMEFWQRSTAAIATRVQRDALGAGLTGKKKSEAEQSNRQFWGLVKVVYRLAPEGHAPSAASAGEMFQTAQWALSSEAAQSLAQMAAREAKGDPVLAGLVRERQDKLAEWQGHGKLQAAALGQDTAKRNAKMETKNRERMEAIDKQIAAIDQRLKIEFPNYAALASPAPLSVAEAQAQLGADEALVLFLDTPESKPTLEETFAWVVTKTEMRWLRSDLGKAALTREVKTLRCGLDRAAWDGQSPCPKLTGQPGPGDALPFDHARAHRLYKALFGETEDMLKEKHLLIVPSGALTQLPFAVLLTAPPASGDNRAAAWLARDHAITILPAVSSLKALRATGRPSSAPKALIGFGNPLLDGDQGHPIYGATYRQLAKQAREKQICPKSPWKQVAEPVGLRETVTPVETRGGFANIAQIRKQLPLPETADELCAVARDIGADIAEMRLGARATETEVKAMSKSGKLAQYRIVHFATHGAMAGELRGSAEPGLILTPPETASEADDGYLSASEIAALKLDADWVILSACNTAAGSAPNAEALSGLARAFIYAQARALLVSHWAVNSKATVKLITTAIREMAREKTVGRAEALRRAMLALIDKGEPYEAHPAYWAPFIVVGEGGR